MSNAQVTTHLWALHVMLFYLHHILVFFYLYLLYHRLWSLTININYMHLLFLRKKFLFVLYYYSLCLPIYLCLPKGLFTSVLIEKRAHAPAFVLDNHGNHCHNQRSISSVHNHHRRSALYYTYAGDHYKKYAEFISHSFGLGRRTHPHGLCQRDTHRQARFNLQWCPQPWHSHWNHPYWRFLLQFGLYAMDDSSLWADKKKSILSELAAKTDNLKMLQPQ